MCVSCLPPLSGGIVMLIRAISSRIVKPLLGLIVFSATANADEQSVTDQIARAQGFALGVEVQRRYVDSIANNIDDVWALIPAGAGDYYQSLEFLTGACKVGAGGRVLLRRENAYEFSVTRNHANGASMATIFTYLGGRQFSEYTSAPEVFKYLGLDNDSDGKLEGMRLATIRNFNGVVNFYRPSPDVLIGEKEGTSGALSSSIIYARCK
jgi:hypothetical protein